MNERIELEILQEKVNVLTASNAKLKEEVDTLRYCLKGMCAEHLTLRVELNPLTLATDNDVFIAQRMSRHHALAAAHAIEERLGDRKKLLEELALARMNANPYLTPRWAE